MTLFLVAISGLAIGFSLGFAAAYAAASALWNLEKGRPGE